MDRTGELAAVFRRECAEDFVGLWQISRALGAGATRAEHAEEIIAVVNAMLDDDTVAIGQFKDGEFVEWKDPHGEIMDRLRCELIALDRKPTIGEVAWLVQRSEIAH